MTRFTALLGFAAAVTFGGPASAADASGTRVAQAGTTAAAAEEMIDGEVRKVDKDAGKLTLRHGEIKSLDMPAMTMVFVVRDKAMLEPLKAGDKVRFKAINDGGRFTVTEIKAAP